MVIGTLAIIALGFSCGKSYEGYGVVLWAPEGSGLKNNVILPIKAESKLRKIYMLWDDIARQDYELDLWRVEKFNSEKEAIAFQEAYKAFENLYGVCEIDGVPPVREEASNSGTVKIITTPVEGQALKIIGRSEEAVEISGMQNYWYEVLVSYMGIDDKGEYSELGAKGFCFGERLKIIEVQGNLEESINKALQDVSNDDTLNKILQNPWRPLYFKNMINQGRYDLDYFKAQVGFFCDHSLKQVTIQSSKTKHTFNYSKILRVSQGVYSFQDTDLRVSFISENRITVQYKVNGSQSSMVYVLIDDQTDIEELIEKETLRRKNIFELIYKRGNSLSSSAYGRIILNEDWGFRWSGYNKLSPGAIPSNASGYGHIDFKYHLSRKLAQKYDGIISFLFSNLTDESGINFLYKLSDEGIQLYYIDNSIIEDLLVQREPSDPLIIFFFFGST